jgi:hypothetical protein
MKVQCNQHFLQFAFLWSVLWVVIFGGTAAGAEDAEPPVCPPRCPADSTLELVDNGGFEAGDTGFTSDAKSVLPPFPHGQRPNDSYAITADASKVINLFTGTGDGQFLVVSSPKAGKVANSAVAWQQEAQILVVAELSYCISARFMTISSEPPATVELQINHQAISMALELPRSPGRWTQLSTPWTAQESAEVSFQIIAKNPRQYGHDFAIDDIHFQSCDTAPDPTPPAVNAGFSYHQAPCSPHVVTVTADQTHPKIEHRWDFVQVNEEGIPGTWSDPCSDSICRLTLEEEACSIIRHHVHSVDVHSIDVHSADSTWEEEIKTLCVPKIFSFGTSCEDPELQARIACLPGEVAFQNECGCGCRSLPFTCAGFEADAGPNQKVAKSARRNAVKLGTPGREGCSYSWSPSTGLDDPNSPQPGVSRSRGARRSIAYQLTVRCGGGCETIDQVLVEAGVNGGRLPFPVGTEILCNQPRTLLLEGYSGNRIGWHCAGSPTGPWTRCPGASNSPQYTTTPLTEKLWVCTSTKSGRTEEYSNSILLSPRCLQDLEPQVSSSGVPLAVPGEER